MTASRPTDGAGESLVPDEVGSGSGDQPWRTRPGTPMIGPYSVHQMDDFYAALAIGQVKPTGVMNYLQRLYIAERVPAGARVVDVCCGRGLQLPVLYRYAPAASSYVGLDISPENLAEAETRITHLDHAHAGRPFPIQLHCHDAAAPWPDGLGLFEVAVYTSALEHLPAAEGRASLRHVADHLVAGGRLYLSTPNTSNTPGPHPRPLQHRVHVYERHSAELLPLLAAVGLTVLDQVGLLPPDPEQLADALTARYGPGAAAWYRDLTARVPDALLGPITAAAIPQVASEVLYVCERPL